ncbi:MAG: GFA family protein [Pseudomonadales bacterium]|nr:GFA family protein [Pseudomonadales bacterium]
MNNTVEASGSCLCGKVKVVAAAMATESGCCHCGSCRKWGGGPMMTVECNTEVSFEGEELIRVYASSDWAERGFCANCGSHLFYRLKPTGQYYMPVGLFDGDNPRQFTHQVFIDEKPDYYDFANRTHNLTGEQIFAQFAEQQQGEN